MKFLFLTIFVILESGWKATVTESNNVNTRKRQLRVLDTVIFPCFVEFESWYLKILRILTTDLEANKIGYDQTDSSKQ